MTKADAERPSQATLNDLLSLVQREARAFGRRSNWRADVEELSAVGALGLAQALDRSSPKAEGFRSYALQRIRGAMLDYLRQTDPLGRGERKAQRRANEATDRLRVRLGREPEAHEVAHEAGLQEGDYERLRQCDERRQRVAVVNTLRPPSSGEGDGVWLARDGSPDPEQAVMRHMEIETMERLTRLLDDRVRLVLERRYYDNTALVEISQELGVSPSRASQLLRRGLRTLRELADNDGPAG